MTDNLLLNFDLKLGRLEKLKESNKIIERKHQTYTTCWPWDGTIFASEPKLQMETKLVIHDFHQQRETLPCRNSYVFLLTKFKATVFLPFGTFKSKNIRQYRILQIEN